MNRKADRIDPSVTCYDFAVSLLRPNASSMIACSRHSDSGVGGESQLVNPAQKVILAFAESVIRQQFVVDHVLVWTNKCQDRADMFLIVVHAGNERRAGN